MKLKDIKANQQQQQHKKKVLFLPTAFTWSAGCEIYPIEKKIPIYIWMNHHYTTRDIVLSPCTHDIFWFLERRKAKKNTRSEEEKIINEQQDTALVIFRSARSKRTALKRLPVKHTQDPKK